MLAAQVRAPRQFELVQQPRPVPGDGEVLVRVLACGVCGSDQNAWQGVVGAEYPLAPGLPGHEVWGEVAEVSGNSQLRTGQPVTGLVQNGFAQFAVAREDELLTVPRERFGTRPLLGEPLACAANLVRRAGVQPGSRTAVVGFGYLAALAMRLLHPVGAGDWIVVSRRSDSRELARRMGASDAYDFGEVPADLWDTFPVVIEAAGVQQTLDIATWLTAYGGRLVIAGYHADGARTVNLQSWNWKGIDVINAHERQPRMYLRGLREALDIVERHGLAEELQALTTHQWPLARTAEALATAERRPPGFVKGVVLPWE